MLVFVWENPFGSFRWVFLLFLQVGIYTSWVFLFENGIAEDEGGFKRIGRVVSKIKA